MAVVLGVAAYVGTLAAAFGPVAAKSGMYLSIWPLFALMLGSADTEPWAVVVPPSCARWRLRHRDHGAPPDA